MYPYHQLAHIAVRLLTVTVRGDVFLAAAAMALPLGHGQPGLPQAGNNSFSFLVLFRRFPIVILGCCIWVIYCLLCMYLFLYMLINMYVIVV
jgi:hypothetical protein